MGEGSSLLRRYEACASSNHTHSVSDVRPRGSMVSKLCLSPFLLLVLLFLWLLLPCCCVQASTCADVKTYSCPVYIGSSQSNAGAAGSRKFSDAAAPYTCPEGFISDSDIESDVEEDCGLEVRAGQGCGSCACRGVLWGAVQSQQC